MKGNEKEKKYISMQNLFSKVVESSISSSGKDIGCGQVTDDFIGKKVKLSGWVETIRDHGGVKFIDLIDSTGEIQVVARPENFSDAEKRKTIEELGDWWVLEVHGTVRRRPEGTENPKIKTGGLEVIAEEIKVLSTSEIPPFSPKEKKEISEELRLKFRYIDLRTERMRRNIYVRHLATRKAREFMWSRGFLEIETPFLTKSTPEGARDFLVPSRLHKGKFYALPQSPQLFKQILQVAGFERYFQIVRCFRDEDLRADRQPEFTQIDIEMSFVSEDDVISITEELLRHMFKEVLGVELETPFRRMSYSEAMEKYGTDKPDTRIKLSLHDLTQSFGDTKLQFIRNFIESGGRVLGFGAPELELSKSKLVHLEREAKGMGAGGLMWFVVKNSEVVASPVLKYLSENEKRAVSELCGGNGITFAVADMQEKARDVISRMMRKVALENSYFQDGFSFVWIVDFPLFSWDETEGRYVSEHHPFTAPRDEDIPFLEEKPLDVRARAYDIVLNGEEIGGGSIRIHRYELQKKVFRVLRISDDEVEERFGWFLEALKYGAPPHGGIALGLDRIVALMLGEESIRDVITFPKTQSGVCPLTQAPSDVYSKQLDELGIYVKREDDQGKGM